MNVLTPAWVALARYSGRFDPWPVLERFGGPEALGAATPRDLVAAGVPMDIAARAAESLSTTHQVLFAGAAGYPPALDRVPFAPPVLFLQGNPEALHRPAVAIVGTRAATAYGRRMAAELAESVARAGGTVVSGMAIGIDQAAHEAALERGFTIGVPGLGLDASDRQGALRLRARILEAGGAILSEFLPSWPATRFSFLQRNRVIAGLARHTVVVEAGHRSGALNTARHALAMGREVMAVPGPTGEGNSEGCLDLLQDGAPLVRCGRDLCEVMGLVAEDERSPLPAFADRLAPALLEGGTVDDLARKSGLDAVEIIQVLSRLLGDNLIVRQPGQRYFLRR